MRIPGLATILIHFCFLFVKNHSISWRANTFHFPSSQQLPRLHLGPFKGFLSWHDALQGPSPEMFNLEISYQYLPTNSCSNQLINSISTWIPKLLFFSQTLIFRAFLQRNSHQRFPVLLSQNQNFGDSRFKSCLGIILGIEVRAVKDSESGLKTENWIFAVLKLEPKSKF